MIVTKGNVDLLPVLDSLIFRDIVIWDNSVEEPDEMTYGRVRALELARHAVIWSQDDDIIHTAEAQAAIVAAYQPGVLTGCMWGEWSDGAKAQGIVDGYDDLVFPGSGSVYDSAVPRLAVQQYLGWFPLDDFFRLWCDTIVGIVAPTEALDIRFEALPWAEDEDRMCNLPNAVALKTEAIRRGRWVRSMVKQDAHAIYMAEAKRGEYHEHRYL